MISSPTRMPQDLKELQEELSIEKEKKYTRVPLGSPNIGRLILGNQLP